MDGSQGLLQQIEQLRREQQEARRARQQIARTLRNAQRRKRRLKSRARMLSNEDLVAVLLMRDEQKEKEPAAEPAEPLASDSDADMAAPPPEERADADM